MALGLRGGVLVLLLAMFWFAATSSPRRRCRGPQPQRLLSGFVSVGSSVLVASFLRDDAAAAAALSCLCVAVELGAASLWALCLSVCRGVCFFCVVY